MSDDVIERAKEYLRPGVIQHREAAEFARTLLAEHERAEKAEARVRALEVLLMRYRNETPLGHQPHMIANEVDEALATPVNHQPQPT